MTTGQVMKLNNFQETLRLFVEITQHCLLVTITLVIYTWFERPLETCLPAYVKKMEKKRKESNVPIEQNVRTLDNFLAQVLWLLYILCVSVVPHLGETQLLAGQLKQASPDASQWGGLMHPFTAVSTVLYPSLEILCRLLWIIVGFCESDNLISSFIANAIMLLCNISILAWEE